MPAPLGPTFFLYPLCLFTAALVVQIPDILIRAILIRATDGSFLLCWVWWGSRKAGQPFQRGTQWTLNLGSWGRSRRL